MRHIVKKEKCAIGRENRRRKKNALGPKGVFDNGNIGALTRRVPVNSVVPKDLVDFPSRYR